MAKQKFLKLTGLILASHLVLSACQAAQQPKQAKTGTVQSSSSSRKTKPTVKQDKKKQEQETKADTSSSAKSVPGVTVPTSDGFILTEQSKILSRTKDGIVVDHNGHSHFIFYADLQGTKFAHLIPSGTVVTDAPKQARATSASQSATDEHHYDFNPADIVAEDALGYTVRHGDHYHYILKSSLTNQQQAAATSHIQTAPVPLSSGAIAEQPGSSGESGIAGIDYPTSDGFLFDGTGIRGWTEAGLLVDHDGHLHVLLTADLAKSKWAHLLPGQPTLEKPGLSSPDVDQPRQPFLSLEPADPGSIARNEVAEKRAYLAQATGLSADKLILIHTPEGPAFLYPHDDHTHVVLLSKLDVTQPFDDGHGHHTRPSRPETTRPSQPIVPAPPIHPSHPTPPAHDEVAEKRAYLAQATGLSEDQISLLDTPNGPAFMYPHGNHSHLVLLSNLDVTQPFDDGHGHEEEEHDTDASTDTDGHDESPHSDADDGRHEGSADHGEEGEASQPPTSVTPAPPIHPSHPTPPAHDEVAEKRAYLAQATGLSEDQISLLDTPNGPAFMYPHGNHSHLVLLSNLDVTQPFDDGHGHEEEAHDTDAPTDTDGHYESPHSDADDGRHEGSADHGEEGEASQPPTSVTPAPPIHPSHPTPPAHDEVAEKRAYLAQATGLSEDQISLLDTPNGSAFMYPHGNHSHLVLLSNLDVTQPFNDGHGHEEEAHDDGESDHVDTPAELPEAIVKQREELANQLNLPVDRIRVVTVEGQITGFEYPHEDHYDFVAIADVAKVTKPLTAEEKQALTAYIRKAYGLLLGTPVHFHDNFVVFAIPHPHQDYDASRDYTSDVLDPNYDAGHVHPYSVPLHLLKIPAVTGHPELDFDNELQAAAERLGIPASEVKIKDGKYFVLPGKDHDHYLNILTPREGYDAYLSNKLPMIKAGFASGDFSKEAVIAEVERVREAAVNKYGQDSPDYRRILRALEEFKAGLELATTSTEAYKEALLSFENRYVTGNSSGDETSHQELDPLAVRYTALTEQLAGFAPRTLRAYGVHSDQMIATLKGFVESRDIAGLDRVAAHLNAIARVEAAPSELAPRVAYMDYLIRSIDHPQLPAHLRHQAISKVMALHSTPRIFKTELADLAALKEQIKLALSSDADNSRADQPVEGSEPLFRRQDVVSYVNQMREFLVRRQEVTAEELAEGFSENLPLFAPERPAPQPSRQSEEATTSQETPSQPAVSDSPSIPETPSPETTPDQPTPAPQPEGEEDGATDDMADLFDDFTDEELEELLEGLTNFRNQPTPNSPEGAGDSSEAIERTDDTVASPDPSGSGVPDAIQPSQPSTEPVIDDETEEDGNDFLDDFSDEELADLLAGLGGSRPLESGDADQPSPSNQPNVEPVIESSQPNTPADDASSAVQPETHPSPTADEPIHEAAEDEDTEDMDDMDDILAALDALKKARDEMNWFD